MVHKLLVFDDGLGVAKLVRSILADEPFDVIEGDKDRSLPGQCKQYEAELVLLDFHMGSGVDGYELSSTIKNANKDLKVVLVFDTFDQPDNDKIQEVGVDDYIYRPFDGEKLVKTCRHLMGLETTRITKMKEIAVQQNSDKSLDQIEEEVSNWEILVPEVINQQAEFSEESADFENNLVPGIIEKVEKSQKTKTDHKIKGPTYPSAEDLAFPDEPTRTNQTMVMKSPALPEELEINELKEEKTALVDLTQIAATQKDLLGKLKEQIQDEVETDFWTPEDTEIVNREASQNHSSNLTTQAEEIFEKVEKNALKHEILATIREQMLQDLKKEIFTELRAEIITNLTDEERESIIHDLKNNVIKEMKDKIYDDLFLKLSKEIHQEIWQKLRDDLFNSGSGFLEGKISKYFMSDVIPMLKNDVPALTQELIQNELIRIRRLIDNE